MALAATHASSERIMATMEILPQLILKDHLLFFFTRDKSPKNRVCDSVELRFFIFNLLDDSLILKK